MSINSKIIHIMIRPKTTGPLACGPLALIGALILCQTIFRTPNSQAAADGSAQLFQQAEAAIATATKTETPGPESFDSARILAGHEPLPSSNQPQHHDGHLGGPKPCACKRQHGRDSSNTSIKSSIRQKRQQLEAQDTRDTAFLTLRPEGEVSVQVPSGRSARFDLNATSDDSQSVSLHEGQGSGDESVALHASSELPPEETEPVHSTGSLAESGHATEFTAESKNVEQHSDCALVLKRTYIIKSPTNDEWGDKFVFNEVDPEIAKERVQKSDLCIKFTDVDKAIEEAKHKIKFEEPNDLDSFEVSEASLGAVGDLNLATAEVLTHKFDLSHDEILNALPMIDMSSSKFFSKDLCPKIVRPMSCTKSRYRTMSGHCNNIKHSSWGASKTPYSRYLPPDYADGLSLPRANQEGDPLPSARKITSTVHRDIDDPTNEWSSLFPSFGQLVNHDMTRHAVSEAPDCCPQYLKGRCMPIPVPPSDPFYTKFNVKCLKFDRSLAAIRPKCLLGMRAQINLVTAPIDASFCYGSTKGEAAQLRTFNDGKMKVWNYFEKLKLKPLLPPQTENPDNECLGRPSNLFCFMAGDVRVNEQTHLTVLQTIYVREHNRIAKQLAKMNVEWDDNKIYHETRHIVAAITQHILSNEFLPTLLGHKLVGDYKIKPSAVGHWTGYDPGVTISTGTAFASAAFRYGHSMVDSVIKRFDKMGHFIKGELLRFLFKRPFVLYEPGAIDQLIQGMVLSPAEQTDPWVSEELSGYLFKPPKASFGHDLAAINIQRGRDQGVPGYNDWREWCGLSRAKSFSDLEPLLMNKTAHYYSKIYKHVDDIDLWSAGIAERKMPGSAVGPTMACIISRQFINTKRGDRFWYENPGQPSSFTPAQLKEIKKVTIAKLLCTNGDDIPKIQPWAMLMPHPIYNAKVPCESLPSMSLKPWDSGQSK